MIKEIKDRYKKLLIIERGFNIITDCVTHPALGERWLIYKIDKEFYYLIREGQKWPKNKEEAHEFFKPPWFTADGMRYNYIKSPKETFESIVKGNFPDM